MKTYKVLSIQDEQNILDGHRSDKLIEFNVLLAQSISVFGTRTERQ
jgi:hypothetical protein